MAHVFRVGSELYRSDRLPMGGRPSVAVATSTTKVLASGTLPTVRLSHQIDNVRFSGDRDDVVESAWRFVQNCRECGVPLNEVDVSTCTRDDVANLYSTKDTVGFMGECCDYLLKTIWCRQTHIDRVGRAFDRIAEPLPTHSDYFRLYGLLMYCSETLGLETYSRLRTRTFFHQLARNLAYAPDSWQKPCTDAPPLKELAAWVAQVRANRPAQLLHMPQPNTVVIGDACRVGYGGVIIHRDADGVFHTEMHQRRWDPRTLAHCNVQHSTVSEPEAAIRLLGRATTLYPGCTAIYVTDHEAFVDAVERGSSISPVYNARVSAHRRKFTMSRFVYAPGGPNPSG